MPGFPAAGPPGGPQRSSAETYAQVQASPEFAALRRRWRGFIFPVSALFLIWFLAYVLLSAYAPGIVNTRVGGSNITVGLLFGLLQFVSTFAIATIYSRFAEKELDPEASRLRAEVEDSL
ncbi:DUF485 domain-containing protein [Actinomycetospora endophytica]|uniref:DUF485 domain-containing protein n=1 Tax=Actinomycetospora endophytica TaxID=2291215 RepID=A0ABS8PHX3_9PSEU|nr:DUF485 domain-containing protein [Actinomycetospora endophytica]